VVDDVLLGVNAKVIAKMIDMDWVFGIYSLRGDG
jgi:hypothetical protein